MKFVVYCSCKTWIGYASNEDDARALTQTHLSKVEHSRSPIQQDGAHVLTVRPEMF